MACAPSEDSDQRIRPVWSVFVVRMKNVWVLIYPLSAQRRLWSDWADAKAHLSVRWAHSHFVGFVMRRLECLLDVILFRVLYSVTKVSSIKLVRVAFWPHCITFWPHCVTLWPHCITFWPHCITFWPHCITLWPHCITLWPHCITFWPHCITFWPHCITFAVRVASVLSVHMYLFG